MKKQIFSLRMLVVCMLIFGKSFAQREFVQQIILDKPVAAGKLKVFPGVYTDSNSYYYLPNKLRLAVDEQGQHKFLFLYYVTNVGSGDADETAAVGKTGGYVHLVVGLHVLPEELEEARQELRKINPRGVIKGPVIYRNGTISLITKSVITNSGIAATDPNTKRVLGIGPAPVMEGDNLAVSFLLDSLDAKIMWESLQMPTPDISFNLNMTLAGFLSPLSFTIVMDWDKVYQHKIFNAGLATPILKAEVGIASQELKERGAIRIVQVGEDPNLQKLQDVITSKLLDMCFVPFGAEGSPNWQELAKPLNDGKSFLDRASESLTKETEAVERRNRDIREHNTRERLYTDEENRKRRAENDVRRKAAQEELAKREKEAAAARAKIASETDATRKAQAEADANQKQKEVDAAKAKVAAENELEKKEADLDAARKKADAEKDPKKKEALEKDVAEKEKIVAEARRQVDDAGALASLENEAMQPTREKPTSGDPDGLGEAFRNPTNYKNADKPVEDVAMSTPDIKKEQEIPSIAVVASYQQKKVRHTGQYVAEAKSYLASSLGEPFGDNIGKPNCRNCIAKINTYDPLYVQREVVAYLDGEIAGEFNKYINSVTVMLRKKHAGGDITTKEVIINRQNFMKEGNRFKLLYGWMKGDDDRRNWLNYEYKTTWNFFGGATVETPWKSSDIPVISLSAPASKYTVFFEADPDKLRQNDIRAVTVRIYYKIAGIERMKQVGMNTSKGFTSATLDYILPQNEAEYEYELEWVKGSTNVKSARIKTSQTTVYVDEIR